MLTLRAAFVAVTLSMLIASHANAHARLTQASDIRPRNTSDSLKTAPCGGVARTATSTPLTANANVTLRWEETIQHRGTYYIEVSLANDTGFQRIATIPDVQDDPIPLGSVHSYEYSIAVPNVNCTGCTVRLVQEMRDNAADPNAITGFYYSCADIQISGGTGNSIGGQAVPDDYGGPGCQSH